MSQDDEDIAEYTMDKIVHYSSYTGGNASEYIVPRGRIDITSHGMGSGIYGLSLPYLNKYPASRSYNAEQYTFTIDSPYTISDNNECERYIFASKQLQRRLQEFADMSSEQDVIITEDNFLEISMEFIKNLGNTNFSPKLTVQALQKFWEDYNARVDFVAMPINYIMQAHEIDGVMSSMETSCHSWHKGDVKFVPYPTMKDGDDLPVAIFSTRRGIQTKPIDLRRFNYQMCEGQWVKQPNGVATCKYCSSDQHQPLFCSDRKRKLSTL